MHIGINGLFPSTVMKWRRELSKRLSIVGCRLSPCLLLAKSVFERMSLPAEMNHGVVATSVQSPCLPSRPVALSPHRPVSLSFFSYFFLISYWLLCIEYCTAKLYFKDCLYIWHQRPEYYGSMTICMGKCFHDFRPD